MGSALKYYDFAIYGTASALVFKHLFFPGLGDAVGLVAIFATYAVGFFARPSAVCSSARSVTGTAVGRCWS